MYTSTQNILSKKTPIYHVRGKADFHFGLKMYKDDEVLRVDIDDTRRMWNILVFKSVIYIPEMGYISSGVYVTPVFDIQNGVSLGNHFNGFLLSIPLSSWRVFDIYNLDSQFMSFHFRPLIELEDKEANSLFLMMSLMENSLADGAIPYNDMELIYLCRAFIATIRRYFSLQSALHDVPTTGNRCVEGFLRLLEKHCIKEKRLDFYAKHLGVTSKYLSSAVSKATGKKANRWISDCVIERANNLLCSTSLPISEIAYKLGFANSSDFCRFYRANTGVPPMKSRREILKQRMM